jgi:hypothetical protein
MVIMFEIAPPFRFRPKVEMFGALVRIIWGYFSVSHISGGVNDIAKAFRTSEREECAAMFDAIVQSNNDRTPPGKAYFAKCAAEAIRARSSRSIG